MEICCKCVNDTRNPTIDLHNGLCQVCRRYQPDQSVLDVEKLMIVNRKAMIGMSGGKDSTATAITALQLGMKLTAFTFESGYYPSHISSAARFWAGKLDIPHETIDIRPHITPKLRQCFRLTADLFDKPLVKEDCLKLYALNRKHYSVKDQSEMPFLRGCQLCRKMVIPAYYAEAVKRDVNLVILGMNEWAQITQDNCPHGIRMIKPTEKAKAVFIVHLPFILGHTIATTKGIVEQVGWQPPRNEDLVETNGNSCCLARATQRPFYEALEFHPDTTRLAREVTCGFLDRETALSKLGPAREYNRSVRQVLREAGII